MIVSQRGVVFFRKQDDITNDLQKQLVQRLGELSGKPETSKLHIHPVINAGRRLGGGDNEISVISSEQAKEIYKNKFLNFADRKQSAKGGWHSDITFEKIPSDYALLRLTELPKTGGGKSNAAVPLIAANADSRHSLGLGIRTVRPPFTSVPEVLRGSHCHICAAGIQPRRKRKWFRLVRQASRRP